MSEAFEPGDMARMTSGKPRWQVMIARSRKYLVQEGWIEPGVRKTWEITSAGRKAANASVSRMRKTE